MKILTSVLEFLYPLLFVIPALLLIWLIYAAYYRIKIRLVDRLTYTREFADTDAFAGDPSEIVETIYNPSFLPVFKVDVESYIPGGVLLDRRSENEGMQMILSRFTLPPFTKITRRHAVTCIRRGTYSMNSASVLTKGFRIEATKYFEFSSQMYVYPRLLEHEEVSRPVSYALGNTLSNRRILYDPFAVSGVRDWAPGDPFRMINFKATAKSCFTGQNTVKVNQYDYCADRVFQLYLNFQTDEALPTAEYEERMEYALSMAASFVSEALRAGYRVGLSANCAMVNGSLQLNFPIAGGEHSIREILRELAQAEPRCGISFPALLDGGVKSAVSGTEVFVLTSYTDESMDEAIEFLQKTNSVTVVRL